MLGGAVGVGLVLLVPSTPAQIGSSQKISSVLEHSMLAKPENRQLAWVFFSDKPQTFDRTHFVSNEARQRRALRGTYNNPLLDYPVAEDYIRALKQAGAEIRATSRWFNSATIEANSNVITAISQMPFVIHLEQIRTGKRPAERILPLPPYSSRSFKSGTAPSGLDYGLSRSQLEQIGVPELHARGLAGDNIIIALLDDGFHKNHKALENIDIIGEYDFVFQDRNVERDPNNPEDYDDEHGLMTLSTIGGYAPGSLVGPAYNAKYLLAKTEDGRSETPLEEDYWVSGLEWAEANGADVVSSSLGYMKFDDSAQSHDYPALNGQTIITSRAANTAAELGVVVVNSIGNEGPSSKSIASPADALGAIAVGAIDAKGMLALFSSRGPVADFDSSHRYKPDVVARGVSNYVATKWNYKSYGRADGTSFSCPLTAGVAALLLEAHHEWRPEDIRQALTSTAWRAPNTPPDNNYGYGIVQGNLAVDASPALSVASIASTIR